MAIVEHYTINGLTPEQFAALKYKRQEQKHEPLILCPFRMLRDCASLKCTEDCALRCADGCGMMVSDAPLTGGTICPMKPGFKCNPACVLHGVNGCNLRKLIGVNVK